MIESFKINSTLLFVLISFSAYTQTEAQKSELTLITETLNHYIEGTANGEPERLKIAFHPDFNLYSVVEEDSLRIWKGSDYISGVEPGKKSNRIGKIISIDIENNAAMAKAEILIPGWRVFTDYFLLLKYEGSWKIVHKSYTWRSCTLNEGKTFLTYFYRRDWEKIKEKSNASIIGHKYYNADSIGQAFFYRTPGYLYSIQDESNHLKEGHCIWFYPNGMPMSEGYYMNDKPVGEFYWYNEKGELDNISNFRHKALKTPLNSNDLLVDVPDKPAQFKGGREEVKQFIDKHVDQTVLSQNLDAFGLVYLSFIVESDGTLTSPKVIFGESLELNKEAIRLIALMPLWMPAELKGKTYRTEYRLAINFKTEFKESNTLFNKMFK